MDHPTAVGSGADWGSIATPTSQYKLLTGVLAPSLAGGVDAEPVTGDITTGWDLFSNAELVDVNLLITGPWGATAAKYAIDNVAETRRDCIAFCSPALATVQNNVGDEANDIITERQSGSFNVNSSYGVMDTGWKYQYDKYNDKYRWVPLNADVAGLCARTDNIADPWFSPGGLNRGQIKNVVKLAYSPDKTDRDLLYKNGINPVVSFPGDGTVLFGDKTLLTKPSAFDRINVRRLFIVLEKAIALAAKYQLFEFNDAFTRSQFRNLVEPFLRDVQGRRGIYDFRVICDETNNTGEIIDTNQFVADIYIKPARSINFMTLNFVATRTGVSFNEIVGA
jgi:phage tail sheath protein FI